MTYLFVTTGLVIDHRTHRPTKGRTASYHLRRVLSRSVARVVPASCDDPKGAQGCGHRQEQVTTHQSPHQPQDPSNSIDAVDAYPWLLAVLPVVPRHYEQDQLQHHTQTSTGKTRAFVVAYCHANR